MNEDYHDNKPNYFDKAINLSNYKYTLLIAGVVLLGGLAIWLEPKTTVPLLLAAGGYAAMTKRG